MNDKTKKSVSSPSPRDEGVGRGTGRGDASLDVGQKPPQTFRGTPLSLALSLLRRERVFGAPCSQSYGLLRNPPKTEWKCQIQGSDDDTNLKRAAGQFHFAKPPDP